MTEEESNTSHVSFSVSCTYGVNPDLLVDEAAEDTAQAAAE